MTAGPESAASGAGNRGALRVLWVTSAYPGGAEDPRGAFLHRLARALAREGIDVTVLCPAIRGPGERERRDGVRVERVRYWVGGGGALTSEFAGIVPTLRRRPWLLSQVPVLVAALALRARRGAARFDLVHAHWLYPSGIAAAAATWRRRIPFVVTAHGTDLELAGRSYFLRGISRGVVRRADACVGVSHAACAALRALGAPPDRVHFLPLGVDAEPMTAWPRAEDASLREFERCDGLRVVFVGRLIPVKSVETLLAAHRLLEARGRRVATALVGSGPSEASLRRRARGLGRVVFAGAQPPSAVAAWIRAAHVLVLPSLAEGRGVVLLEAMAQGRPVVASDIPGPRELVRPDVSGLLFPAGNAERLADALDRLRDPERRRRFGAAGRELIETEGLWSEQVARRHRDLYERTRHRTAASGPA